MRREVSVRLFCVFCLISLLLSFQELKAENIQPATVSKDMVWVASDGLRREVFHSAWQDGAWSQPAQISHSEADKISPSMDVAKDGTRYLVWTAVDGTGHHIHYATFADKKWSDARSIPGLPSSCTGAFVTSDKDGTVWVVFSGNNDGDDDVYVTRFKDGQWTEISLVHPDNDTPDINPTLDVAANGKLTAFWEGFRGGSYIMLQSSWNGSSWLPEQPVTGVVNELASSVEQDEIPEFVEDKSMVFIRSYK